MIPRRYIMEWRRHAPWPTDAQVELDLVIERALIDLFSSPFLKKNIAFRGGTALHKIYLVGPAKLVCVNGYKGLSSKRGG